MTNDPFSGPSVGAFSCLSSIDPVTKERSCAANAYYTQVADRPNLHLSCGSIVKQVLLESSKQDDKLRAIGVHFERNGLIVSVKT